MSVDASQRVLAPYYQVAFNGKQLTGLELSLIEEVSYEDTSTGSDLLSITFYDPDFVILDSPEIVKATPVQFSGGFVFNSVKMFDGYVSSVDVTFPENGVASVTVQCMDKSFLMNRIDRKETYKNMRYDQIARKVAQRNGLGIVTENSGKVHEQVTQSDKSDIQFLADLADELEWLVWVKGSTLHFLPANYAAAPSKTYWWRRPPFNLISFNPRLVQADTKDGIDEHDIDVKTGEVVSEVASPGTPAVYLGDNPTSLTDPFHEVMKYDPRTGEWRKSIDWGRYLDNVGKYHEPKQVDWSHYMDNLKRNYDSKPSSSKGKF